MLLGEITANIKRFDEGSWASGEFVRGAADPDFTVVGSFQPDGDTSAEPLERGARRAGRFIFLVELDGQPELQILKLSNIKEGDVLELGGTQYVFVSQQEWVAHSSGLPHRRFILELIGKDETAV